jgi:alkylation response protein AidB-like acyl-CoA dehydrogenase
MLHLKKPQKAIIKALKEFAKGEFDKDVILEMEKEGRFPGDIHGKAAELGFLGIHLPEDIGGGGMGMQDHMLIAETMTQYDSTLGSAVMMSCAGAEWIAEFAGDTLKKRILPGVFEGRQVCGTAFPTPDTGVEVTPFHNETSTATNGEKSFLVNGTMDHVINIGKANILLLPVKNMDQGFVVIEIPPEDKTQPEDKAPPENEIQLKNETQLKDETGLRIEKRYDRMGLRMTSSSRLSLNNIVIPAENYIPLTKKQMVNLICPIRLLISFLALGTARGAIDRSVAYVKGRKQFGKKIGSFQALRQKLASMELQLNLARSLTYLTAENYSVRKPDAGQIAMACLASVSAATAITHDAIQLFGGYGYTVEYEVERFCRDAKTLQLMSRQSILLHDDIADGLIGRI